MKTIEAVLFDFDNTLMLSPKVIAFYKAGEDLGLSANQQKKLLRKCVTGREKPSTAFVFRNAIIEVEKSLGFYKGLRFMRSYGEYFGRTAPKLLIEKDFLESLKAAYKLGVVTMSPKYSGFDRALTRSFLSVDKCMEYLGINGYFGVVVGREDIRKYEHKPSPVPHLKAMNELKVKPEKTLCVDDAPEGIKAGKSSGAKTVGVLTGYYTEEMLRAENPDWIIEDVNKLGEILSGPEPGIF